MPENKARRAEGEARANRRVMALRTMYCISQTRVRAGNRVTNHSAQRGSVRATPDGTPGSAGARGESYAGRRGVCLSLAIGARNKPKIMARRRECRDDDPVCANQEIHARQIARAYARARARSRRWQKSAEQARVAGVVCSGKKKRYVCSVQGVAVQKLQKV